jgi:hypothetical protein
MKFTPHPLPTLMSYGNVSYLHLMPSGTDQVSWNASENPWCDVSTDVLQQMVSTLNILCNTQRVPAHERKSVYRNLFTFGPMLIGTFLLNWGWGIPRKRLWHRFWDTLYTHPSKTINPAQSSNGAFTKKQQTSNRNYWTFHHYNALFHRELFVKHFWPKENAIVGIISTLQPDFWPMQFFSNIFSMGEELEHMYT